GTNSPAVEEHVSPRANELGVKNDLDNLGIERKRHNSQRIARSLGEYVPCESRAAACFDDSARQLIRYAADGLNFSVKESEPLRHHACRCGSPENTLSFNDENPSPQASRRHPGDKA